jgi:hypothetical protein
MSRAKTGYEPRSPSTRRSDVLWAVNDHAGRRCKDYAYDLNYGVGITQSDLHWLVAQGFVCRWRDSNGNFHYEATAAGQKYIAEESA